MDLTSCNRPSVSERPPKLNSYGAATSAASHHQASAAKSFGAGAVALDRRAGAVGRPRLREHVARRDHHAAADAGQNRAAD